MHTLIPTELLPYLQSVAITETKGSLDELVTFNYMYIVYTIYFKEIYVRYHELQLTIKSK